MKLTAALTILAASTTVAVPTRRERDFTVVASIAFRYENGTSVPVVDVPETTSWYPIASNGIVENILIYAPLGRATRCAFLKPEPSRQTLGAWTVTQALLVALNPPAEVGFVQCD
ncbi:hypothetical protein EsH8_II_000676 [Colletotrichum jinshuiense]